MKPYEIEIFDRHYNFRSNALVDSESFSYAYDALSVDKSTLSIPKGKITVREQAESGSESDNTVACSDYIRILSDDNEYIGVIVNVDEDDIYTTLTYEPLHSLLNHEVMIIADDIKHTYIETYIENLLTQEFINNGDTLQNIPNLTITTTSTTGGIMDYNDTSDVYVIINLLNDLIYPAFREYLIRTDISIDFSAKTLNVTIGEISEDSVTVESDLDNIVSKNFTIRKASSMVNKLSLFDTKNYSLAEYDFYLHPSDYSFDQVNNSDRFFPVVNQVADFDSDSITEDAFLEVANESIRAINKYADIGRDLSDAELAELSQALTNFLPYLKASKTSSEWQDYFKEVGTAFNDLIWLQWYGFAGNGFQPVASYQDLEEEGSQHYYFGNAAESVTGPYTTIAYKQMQNVSGLKSTYSVYPEPSAVTAGWGTSSFSGDLYYNTNTHASFVTQVTYRLWTNWNGDIHTWNLVSNVYMPITPSIISSALNAYKQTAEFKAAFAAYKAQNFSAIISGYAKKVFKTSKYQNLIELTTSPDDSMIKPLEMPIGQVVNIIHDGTSYNSILSGREIQKNGLVKLIFGTIRLELTKILNMKGI